MHTITALIIAATVAVNSYYVIDQLQKSVIASGTAVASILSQKVDRSCNSPNL